MRKVTRSRLLGYGVAVFSVALALLLTLLLYSLLTPGVLGLFYAAVAVSTWYGGLWSGLLATAFSTLAFNYFLLPSSGLDRVVPLVVFVLVTLLISSLNAALRSAKQRAEVALAKLRASEDRYRRLIDTANEGIWTLDASGRINYVNQQMAQMLGYRVEEILEHSLYDFMDSVSRLEAQRHIEQRQQGIIEQYDWRFRRKNGSVLWTIVCTNPILDETGELVGTLALITDVTERKRVEDALRESQTLFESFMSHSPVTAFIKDSAGRYIYVNQLLERVFNRKLANWVGKTDFDLFPSQAAQQWRDNDLVVLTTGNTMQMLETVPHDDGEHYYMSFKFPITDVSGRRLIGGMAIDITERQRLEVERNQLLVREQEARRQAEEANRTKDEFLAIVSHELRTPLSAISGWAELLRNRKLDEATINQALETIERNAKTQNQLIEDLLDISRIVQGQLRLHTCPTNMVQVISAALDTVRPTADAKTIQLEFVLDSSIGKVRSEERGERSEIDGSPLTPHPSPLLVSGDPDRLQQVVWNLLSNAVKFTPSGGRVEVRLERIDSYAQIKVTDTGIGISPDFLPYVFERFRQAESTTTKRQGGLGLGLAIVRNLVELHGGTIQVESLGSGQGATFIVQLPLITTRSEVSDLEQLTRHRQASLDFLKLNGLRVLIVDDEIDILEFLVTALEHYGAEVTAAADVGEAMRLLEQLRPDVLLSDIGMPAEDGYALIRRIRAKAPEQGGLIPAVALTAYARNEERTQALLAGFQLHVPKPVNPAELAAVVANLAGWTRKV